MLLPERLCSGCRVSVMTDMAVTILLKRIIFHCCNIVKSGIIARIGIAKIVIYG